MIKESIFRLVTIFLVIIFAVGLFFTIQFLRKNINIATSPSAEVVQKSSTQFEEKTYQEVLKRLQP